MTQEQKAKAYDEAIERAKTLYNSVFVNNDILEQIFPELAESEDSEDERIRVVLCDIVRDVPYIETELRAHGLTVEKTLAYLEKQKEQKPAEWEWPNLSNCIRNCKRCHGKCLYRKEYEEKKQPSEWSKDDEMIRKWLYDYISNCPNNNFAFYGGVGKDAVLNYLENLGNMDIETYKNAEKEKSDFVGDGFIKCYANFLDFKEGETYWLEYVGKDNYNVRSDNLLGKTYHIPPCQLYTVFKKLTWLEKQGEQEPKDKSKFKENSEYERIRKEILAFIRREGQHIDKYKWPKWIEWLENHNPSFKQISDSIIWDSGLRTGIELGKKQKEASKAIETVEKIDKYIDKHLANAHDMNDSNPNKKYYCGWDDYPELAGILQDVYSKEEHKEPENVSASTMIPSCWEEEQKDNKFAPRVLPCSAAWFEDCEEKQKEPDGIWTEEDDAKVKAMCEEGYLKPSERAWLKELKNRIVKKEQKPTEDWREKRKKECPFRRNLDNNLYGCKRYADVISECTGACSWVVDYPKIKEIQDRQKQKPSEWSDADEQNLNVCLSYINDAALRKWLKNAIHVNYTNSVEWSEEDEKMNKEIRLYLKQDRTDFPGRAERINKMIEWLINICPQPKQEWSDEDKHRCKDAIYFLETAKKHYASTSEIELTIEWLKSLKPQAKQEQKEQTTLEYLPKEKVYDIIDKLTDLSYSKLIPFKSRESQKIDEISTDILCLLDYPIEKKQEQKPVDLEKEMDKYYGMYRDNAGETYDIEDNERCFDWKEDELSENKMRMARHFYELGLKAKKDA